MSQFSQGRSRVLSAYYPDAAAASTTALHAAVTDTGVAQDVVPTAQPALARNVTATAGGTSANITAVQVIVTGEDVYGNPLTETLPAFTAATAGTVTGSKAFGRVTSVHIPANGSGVTTAIGTGVKFGLPVKLKRNTVLFTFQDNTRETFAGATVTVDPDHFAGNTIQFVGTPNGSHDYVADYYNNG